MSLELSRHAHARMNARAIRKSDIDLVLECGDPGSDGAVIRLSRSDALKHIEEMKDRIKSMKRIAEKGGVVVVLRDDQIITTYPDKIDHVARRKNIREKFGVSKGEPLVP